MLFLFYFSILVLLFSLTGLAIDKNLAVWIHPMRFSLSMFLYSASLHFGAKFLRRKTIPIAYSFTGALAGGMIVLTVLLAQSVCGSSGLSINNAMISAIARAAILPVALADIVLLCCLTRQKCIPGVMEKAIRWGAFLAAVGFLPGFLLLAPESVQHFLSDQNSAGNLRVAHFVGLHGLQIMPIAGILLTKLASRFSFHQQTALVSIAGFSYMVLIFLLMFQALRGESVLQPSSLTQLLFLLWLIGSAGAVLPVLYQRESSKTQRRRINPPVIGIISQDGKLETSCNLSGLFKFPLS